MKPFKVRNNLMVITFFVVLTIYVLLELDYFGAESESVESAPDFVHDVPHHVAKTYISTPEHRSVLTHRGANTSLPAQTMLPFLPNYKNPCWRNDTTGEVLCIPYFYLLGFGKSGTTSIFHGVCAHSGVVLPPKKEFKFWSEQNLVTLQSAAVQYARLLKPATTILKNSTLRHGIREEYHYKITGEGTPSYIWDGHFLAPPLSKLNINTKFIISMRHPTDRLFSHYHHDSLLSSKSPFDAEDFHHKVTKEVAHLRDCFKRANLKQCITGTTADQFPVGVRRSIYAFYIKAWLQNFPREQFLFIQAEEFYREPFTTLNTIYSFLELPSPSPYTVRRVRESLDYFHKWAESVNKTDYRSVMWPSTKMLLDDFYAPYNQMLRDLLKDDRYIFPRSPS